MAPTKAISIINYSEIDIWKKKAREKKKVEKISIFESPTVSMFYLKLFDCFSLRNKFSNS